MTKEKALPSKQDASFRQTPRTRYNNNFVSKLRRRLEENVEADLDQDIEKMSHMHKPHYLGLISVSYLANFPEVKLAASLNLRQNPIRPPSGDEEPASNTSTAYQEWL